MESRIMNEDVVEEILTYIEFRQLFQMQRISKQFWFSVERLLRRKKCLIFGEMKERWFGRMDESILCADFNHKSNYPLIDKIYSIVLSPQYIIPIVSKCPNIRCLCLNQDLGLETIKTMAQICERLECLCFRKTFLNSEATPLKTIGILFAKKVVHLSIELNDENETIHTEVIELIRHFTSLQNLKIIHTKPLKNVLNFVTENLKHLYIIGPLFRPIPDDEDITSLMSYIQRNKRCLESLFISEYHISEEIFVSICSHLDLKQLLINCKLLSLSSLIRILCKSQPNLSKLALNRLSFENNILDSHRHCLKVRSLRLSRCNFEVKSFIQFFKFCLFLEKLDLNRLFFRCECNPTEFHSFCFKCNQKCSTELSKSKTLKVLSMFVGSTNFSFKGKSLTGIANLKKLKVIYASRKYCKELALDLVGVLLGKPTKYFTLEFSRSVEKTAFVEMLSHLCHEMPRNLRIIC